MASELNQIIDDLNNEQNYLTRLKAVSKLSRYTDGESLTLLLSALQDPYFRVREKAAQNLVRIYDPRVIDPLIAAVTDIPSVRDAALEALQARTLSREVQTRISSYLDTYAFYKRRKELTSDALFLKKRPLSKLLEAAKHPDFLIRETALDALSTISSEEVLTTLTSASNDLYLCVREAALRSLRIYKGPLSASVLKGIMDTTNWPLFDTLVDLLITRDYEHTEEVLVGLLQHEDFIIRRRARAGLSKLPDSPTLSLLLKSLTEWDSVDKAIPAYTIAQFYKEELYDQVDFFSRAMAGLMGSIVERNWPEGIDALNQLAYKREWRHFAFFSTAELDRRNQFDITSALDYTYEIQKESGALYLCTKHLARFHLLFHEGNRYLGCRLCQKTHTSIKVTTLVLVIDSSMTSTHRKQNGSFYINWLENRTWMDFDAVEIGSCSEDAITEFCIDIGNDTDEIRIQRYKVAACYLRQGTTLSTKTMNLLRNHFKKVITL